MKEYPILFSTEMVRAILEGRKTQTRRVITPQPRPCYHMEVYSPSEASFYKPPDWRGRPLDWIGYKYEGRTDYFCHVCGNGLKHIDEYSAHGLICPYGEKGDNLWVCETWFADKIYDDLKPSEIPVDSAIGWVASHDKNDFSWAGKTRPGIFLPRRFSRLNLLNEGVKVQNIQDITDAECEAEGVRPSVDGNAKDWREDETGWRRTFRQLWDKINLPRGYGFDVNPIVWAVKFPTFGFLRF